MRAIGLLAFSLSALHAAESPAGKLWLDLAAKRASLPSFHEEFDIAQTTKTAAKSQASKRQLVIDVSHGKWRERSVTGSGNRIRLFDGEDLFSFEEGGDEYIRAKRNPKQEPQPRPYGLSAADWSKAVERERRSCAIPGLDHQCAILEAPVKPATRPGSGGSIAKVLGGRERAVIDTETGMILSFSSAEQIQTARSAYETDAVYVAKRMSFAAPVEPSLFQLAPELREVKELSRWNAAKIRKQLSGKPAPELSVITIDGKQLSLEDFKGKTVLIDFWTTWCPPCRADAPALDKLYARYSEKDLMIVGVSVSEDRPIVEKFLQEHPHGFPIALTTENELSRPYQIGIFPTYLVIDRDGTVASAVEGDQGFGELRKLLKKAGLEVE